MKPLVTIIIPVYNAEKYVASTIQSAIDQTWPNKQIIVVDDGSTDGSLAVARQFENKGVTVISQKNKGASAARNKGLTIATGYYIQFLDADDILSPNKISSQVMLLNGSQDKLAICKTVYFKDGMNPCLLTHTPEWFKKDTSDPVDFLTKLYAPFEVLPKYGGMIQTNVWLTPRKIIDKIGEWNENLSVDDDGEFFCRVVLACKAIVFCEDCINYYRQHTSHKSLSASLSMKGYQSMLDSINLKHQSLRKKSKNVALIDAIFGFHYWKIGVNSYPQYIKISNEALKRAKLLGVENNNYNRGRISIYLNKLFGWRIARIVTYLRRGN